jgi:hypothetical protein
LLFKGSIKPFGAGSLWAPLWKNTVAGSIFTQRQIRQGNAELQKEIASLTAIQIRHLMMRKIERLQDAGVAMTLYPLGANEQRLLGLLLLKNDRSFSEIAILNDRGQECSSSPNSLFAADLQNQSNSAAYQRPSANFISVL